MKPGKPMQRTPIQRRTRLQAKTAISRSGPIKAKRRKGAVKVGKHTGKIRLYGARLEGLRRKVYERSGGWCESKIADDCWRSVTWDTGHMHHKKHRSLGGSDTMRNCIFICPACHRKEHGR